MGRYYSGDIDGKFWFAVQSSNDADFFGVVGTQPNELEYYFDESNLNDIEIGIQKCKEKLGDNEKKLTDFFAVNDCYNEEMLVKAGFKEEEIKELLEWYARLELGEKILKCVKENKECTFTAEL